MQKYVLRRLALMIPTLVGLSIVVFTMVRIVPGDVVALISGEFGAISAEQKQAILRVDDGRNRKRRLAGQTTKHPAFDLQSAGGGELRDEGVAP